jgi:uncharacterized protein (DUF1330 family)
MPAGVAVPAFLIADVQVTDAAQYEHYRKFSSEAMRVHGAKIRVRGGEVIPLEGRQPGRIVVLEFDDVAAAQAFYDSPEYGQARAAREGASIMNMFIVQGV